MAVVIDGKAVSAKLRKEMKGEVDALKARGICPGLAVVIVGDDPASRVYVNNKKKACAELGIYSEEYALSGDTTEEELLALVDTGIDYTHADLEGRIWVNEDEIPGNGVDDDGNGYIDDVYGWNFYSGSNQVYTGSEDSHGTHGAGTIAAHADNGIEIGRAHV